MPYTKRQSTVGDFPTPSPFVDRTVRAKAKLDFIKFTMPYKAGRGSALANELSKWHSKKQLYMPKKGTNDSLTLHDPKPAQLKFLVDHCPEAHVTAIEVAIDFFPVGTPKTKTPLAEMHRYLTHGLFPTGFALLAGATRKVFLPATGKMKRDPLKARVKANTTYWWNRARKATLRLYVKHEADRHGELRKFVRVEISLNRAGCQDLQVNGFALLPSFLAASRQRLVSAFMVTSGIKFNPRRTRSINPKHRSAVHAANVREEARRDARFTRYGAMWCAKHGLPVARDTNATRMIGGALQRLSRSHVGVKIQPKNRKHVEALASRFLLAYQALSAD